MLCKLKTYSEIMSQKLDGLVSEKFNFEEIQ